MSFSALDPQIQILYLTPPPTSLHSWPLTIFVGSKVAKSWLGGHSITLGMGWIGLQGQWPQNPW